MYILGFDLEVRNMLDVEKPLAEQLPMGITCAVVSRVQAPTAIFKPSIEFGKPPRYSDKMSKQGCIELAEYLCEADFSGDKIVTVNGLGFDFRVLWAEIEGEFPVEPFVRMVRNHVDLGFAMLCGLGYMGGLVAMGKGMGVGGKTEGMDGIRAVELWKGDKEQQDNVITYCSRDAELTAQVYNAVVAKNSLTWITKAGAAKVFDFGKDVGRLTVARALEFPEPDTSWMTSPRKRSDCLGWLGKLERGVG